MALPAALLLSIWPSLDARRALGYRFLEALLVGVWGFSGLAIGLFFEVVASAVFPLAHVRPSPLVLIFGQAGIALGVAAVVIRYRNRERDR